MILPRIIADIAFRAAASEYETARRLGCSGREATAAGCKVMLDIRKIATDGVELVPDLMAAPDGWWRGS